MMNRAQYNSGPRASAHTSRRRQVSSLLYTITAGLAACLFVGPTACSTLGDDTVANSAMEGSKGAGSSHSTGSEDGDTGEQDTGTDPQTQDTGDTEGTEDTSDGSDTGGPPDGELAAVGIDVPPDDLCGDGLSTSIELIAGDSDALALPDLVRATVLDEGGSLPPSLISPRPFLNRYSFDYPLAATDELAAYGDIWEVAKGPSDQYRLQIGISSEKMSSALRPPLHVTIVMDQTASMSGRRLELAAEVLNATSASLKPGDRISLISVGDVVALLLDDHEIVEPQDPLLTAFAGDLQAQGDASMNEAIQLALVHATQTPIAAGQDKILLITGGAQAPTATSIDLAAQAAEPAGGPSLVGVGVGYAGSYDNKFVDDLADAGRGPSLYVGREEDAWTLLNERFSTTMISSARDVTVSVVLPEGMRLVSAMEPLGEAAAPTSAIDLGPNDALVLHYDLELCDAIAYPTTLDVTVEWYDADTLAPKSVTQPLIIESFANAEKPAATRKGAAVVAYARALASVSESEDANTVDPLEVFNAQELIDAALQDDAEDGDLQDMAAVLATLAAG